MTTAPSKQTPLIEQHQKLKAKLVDFAGWHMPLNYGSQIAEHQAVRQRAGVFDVSHMGVVDITGSSAAPFLRYALANNIDKLKNDNTALYSCLLNPQGGIIDDLIVYRLHSEHYRLVINAATRDTDIAWLTQLNDIFDANITAQPDYAIIAVQGPAARQLLQEKIGTEIMSLKRFHCINQQDMTVARTGYTGEDGVECILPSTDVAALWQYCMEQKIQPCGLGARDSLRLEAGLNLYGTDMNSDTSPYISNLAWTVCLKDNSRDFVGKTALEQELARGPQQQLTGVIMTTPGVLRCQQPIMSNGEIVGTITSGGFAPTLNHAIGMARLPISPPADLYIDRRGKPVPIQIHPLPFIRAGSATKTQGDTNANTMP